MANGYTGGRLEGRVALVSGGGRGIGAATCRRFAEEGAAVVVTDIDETQAITYAAELTRAGFKARGRVQNVIYEDLWREVTDEILSLEGRLDVVVNNAGFAIAGTVEDLTLADWERVQAVNHSGVFLGTKYGVIAMRRAGNGGSIINISSVKALVSTGDYVAYDASKGGVRSLTKASAIHCARNGYGIRVNSVHPGWVATDVGQSTGTSPELARKIMEEAAKRHPIGRVGEPVEIANAILFLASDESSFMTGSELVVDGGYTAQ